MKCTHCYNKLTTVFADLRTCPPSNAMVKKQHLGHPETYYPLKVFVCNNCFLVQVEEVKKAHDIFNNEYTYFSSFSTSWLNHCKNFVKKMLTEYQFDNNSLVIEIASNDGYLLQYFKEKEIPVLGIEPSSNTAEIAISKGIETITDFFGEAFAKNELNAKNIRADLIIGNNVLAHVPNINDFVAGLPYVLKEEGIITMEFPHLLNLIHLRQFDTIYHEHFSYLSLYTVQRIFDQYSLVIFDVEEVPTHGGSLRIYGKHKANKIYPITQRVANLLEKERKAGLVNISFYQNFQGEVEKIKNEFIAFLLEQEKKRKKVIGYGAAAKGNTLLNFCGIKGNDLIEFVCDASPHKQGKYLPGSRIPVFSPEVIRDYQPDYIIIFPWNIQKEIRKQLNFAEEWGAQFVIAIPKLQIFS